MTGPPAEFEQQIAAALRDLHTQWAFSSTDFEFCNFLAPRVAAAIQAMGAAHSDAIHWQEPNCEQCALNVQFGIPAALAGLRGVP